VQIILRSKNLNIYSFTNDDSAFVEPNNDIISTALVVIGFVIFAAIITSTYASFTDNSYALDSYKHASMIANDIADSEKIQGSRVDIISAEKLDVLSTPTIDKEKHSLFFQKYSGNIDFSVDICTNDKKYQWTIEKYEGFTNKNDIIAASVPIIVELGTNAQCSPGTLTVKVHRNKWI
jgi:hypothetical protein